MIQLIGRQHNTREIAHMLFIAEKTVENHRANIMKKLALPAEKNALLVWAVKNLPSRLGSWLGRLVASRTFGMLPVALPQKKPPRLFRAAF